MFKVFAFTSTRFLQLANLHSIYIFFITYCGKYNFALNISNKKNKIVFFVLGMEGQINFFLILSENFQLIFSNNKLIADGSKVRKREFGG